MNPEVWYNPIADSLCLLKPSSHYPQIMLLSYGQKTWATPRYDELARIVVKEGWIRLGPL